jgi:hypothetical protein
LTTFYMLLDAKEFEGAGENKLLFVIEGVLNA